MTQQSDCRMTPPRRCDFRGQRSCSPVHCHMATPRATQRVRFIPRRPQLLYLNREICENSPRQQREKNKNQESELPLQTAHSASSPVATCLSVVVGGFWFLPEQSRLKKKIIKKDKKQKKTPWLQRRRSNSGSELKTKEPTRLKSGKESPLPSPHPPHPLHYVKCECASGASRPFVHSARWCVWLTCAEVGDTVSPASSAFLQSCSPSS